MKFIVLNTDDSTEDQLIEAINSNIKTAKMMSSEIEKLRRVSKTASTNKLVVQTESYTQKLPTENKSEDIEFEEEVAHYYSDIKNITAEQLSEKLTEILPSKDNYQYERILCRIASEIMRNINEFKSYILTEEMSSEELSELKEELLSEHKKFDIIKNQLNNKEECIHQEDRQEQENNLIFVPTTGGNIRVLEELDRISPEYYERFYELFQSIKNGTFKNERRHRRDSALSAVSIVKQFNVHVVYTRLDKNNYAIISAYIKKADRDKAVLTSLISKCQDYQAIENKLKANLDNENFIELNRQYEIELFNKLSPTTNEMPVVKNKAGDK